MVSIIVPVYNIEKYIKKCVESILGQTYRNFEVLLVDDGSTDASKKYCEEFEKKDSRIRRIRKENGGLSSARNTGLDYARGDYIFFVDGDDYLEPGMLNSVMKEFEDRSVDAVIFGWYIEYGGHRKRGNYQYNEGYIAPEEGIKLLLDRKGCQSFAWNKVFRRQVWGTIKYPHGRFYEDIFTTWKLISRCDNISVLCAPLYVYVQRGDSISHKISMEKALDYYEGTLERRQALKEAYPGIQLLAAYNWVNMLLGICYEFKPENEMEMRFYCKIRDELEINNHDIIDQADVKLFIKYVLWRWKDFLLKYQRWEKH